MLQLDILVASSCEYRLSISLALLLAPAMTDRGIGKNVDKILAKIDEVWRYL
jgi:hypothetical protein